MRNYFYKMAVLLCILIMMGACATSAPKEEAAAPAEAAATAQETATLYDRLGGKDAIKAVVSDFVDAVDADDRMQNDAVAQRLKAINVDELKAKITNLVCQGAGGPCEYKGRNMKQAHVGLNITDAEFDIVVENLVKTLDKYKVPEKEKNDLLGLLGPMRADVVQAK